ncbi:hypothetical protein JOM56_006783 [Amanita muscaria]
MPRFLGLFSRKAKHTTDTSSANGSDDHDSSVSGSPNASGYLGWDKSVSPSPSRPTLHPGAARSVQSHSSPAHGERSTVYPSSPSPSTASTSKLRLPFGRKRQPSPSPASPGSTTSVNATETNTVQHRAFQTGPRPSLDRERDSFSSDGALTELRRLRPPPSKSAIFAAYADPQGALSTRSLPNEASQPFSLQDSAQPSAASDVHAPSSEVSTTKSAPNSAKKSFFSWTRSNQPTQVAKSRSKSTPPLQVAQEPKTDPLLDLSDSSFNLKSFRHVGPSSSLDIQVPTPALDVPSPSPSPLPRPRGPSVGESSQRISVGAFREAQARRSMAGSPVPSPRSSSPFTAPPVPQEPGGANGRASPRLGPGRTSFLFDTKSDDHSSPQIKNRSALASDSDADTSSAEGESDDDSDYERTVTQRGVWTGKIKAKSELGHMSSRDEHVETRSEAHSCLPRQRASASTSAATPSAAAKRASILANSSSKDPAEYKRTSQHIRESVYSNPGTSAPPSAFLMKQPTRPTSPASDSSSDDDDDAPLATLVPPRRPGSALSSASGSSHPSVQNSTRTTSNLPRGKPLIDINEVIGNKAPSLPVREGRNETLSENKGFTKGSTLLSASSSADVSPSSRIPTPITTSFRMSAGPFTTSPTESVNSSGFATAPSSAKPIPPPSFPLPLNNEQAAQKRDGLNERLTRVANSVSSTANSSSPLSTPPQPNKQSNADVTKMAFPRALISPQSSFERLRSASPAPAASRLSTDLTSLSPSKVIPPKHLKPSPPDEELAKMLGASVKLISRTGESSPEAFDMHQRSSESEDSSDSSDEEDRPESSSREEKTDDWENVDPKEAKVREEYKIKEGLLKGKGVLGGRGKGKGKERDMNAEALAPKVTEPPIAPIPIKQRQPTPSFSVMSRPPLIKNGIATSSSGTGSGSGSGPGPGSGSTSVILSLTSSESLASSSSNSNNRTRQRSSTLLNPSLPDSRASQSSPNASPVMGSSDATRSRGTALTAPPIRSAAISRSSAVSGASAPDKPSNPGTNRSSSAMDSPSSSAGRPRSGTMLPAISVSPVPSVMPVPPFARRESPASSTGDSSSGRAPLTPRDGSDIGSTGGSSSAMKGAATRKNWKRRSVCFEDELRDGDATLSSSPGKGKIMHNQSKEQTEEKRKERRRSEAKAAIELGNVINGRGPIVDDEEEEDMPINQPTQARMSTLNPMMAMGGGMHPMQMGSVPSWNGPWSSPMGQQPMMNGPQYMFPPAADPSLLAAHQQAMMIAKQAYQLAVAQQAAVAAGDEWERGSVASGFSGFGRGMPGSHMTPPYGMGMNMNMNMMAMGHNWPSGNSGIFPSSARSMFGGISSSRSEYGGTAGGGGWNSSKSTYGEAFGPPTGRIPKPGTTERERGHFPPIPPIPPQAQQASSRTTGSPRPRTTSQPTSRTRKSPPSSWKG